MRRFIAVLLGAAVLAGACGRAAEPSRGDDQTPPQGAPTTEAPPAETEPGAIAVDSPSAGAAVSSPVTISGTANVFEAVVSLRLLGADGTELASGFTMATCGSGCRGTYTAELRYALASEEAGTIEAYESSAEDGSPINVVRVPVTLSRTAFAENEGGIVVDAPAAGARITSPVTVSGLANVYEAEFVLRILDAAGTELAATRVLASCGSGCWGDYSATVEYAAETDQPGIIELHELGADDGSWIRVVRIPVTLTATG